MELSDHLAQAEAAVKRATAFFADFSHENRKFVARLDLYTPRLEEIARQGGADRFAKIDEINELVADDLNAYALWLEKNIPGFADDAIKAKDGYTHYFSNITVGVQESISKLVEVRGIINDLLPSVQYNMKGGRTLRDAIGQVGGNYAILNSASARVVALLDELISSFTDLESFCLSAREIITEKLGG